MNVSYRVAYLWALLAIAFVVGSVVAMGILLERQTEHNQKLLCLSAAHDPTIKPETLERLCGDLLREIP